MYGWSVGRLGSGSEQNGGTEQRAGTGADRMVLEQVVFGLS
ncbi:MAG: hypothetical protein J07HX64_01354 [halophilic archaeon J07HX64]|nr:MAG: hypothetical protein J07HX64_01354 [halophilic archaeon J07HX64]